MKILVLQLSDIHISTRKYPSNPILTRTSEILSAVKSLFIPSEEVTACVILVTGDIAYAGRADEYETATPFLQEISRGLSAAFQHSSHNMYFIPGNHDCDFSASTQLRDSLMQITDTSPLSDGSIINNVTGVQDAFFDFCARMNHPSSKTSGTSRLCCQHHVHIAEFKIVINALNSAWCSKHKETATLLLPVDQIRQTLACDPAPDIVITMLHHPYTWFQPDAARSLRSFLEEASDIIFTGHEHMPSSFTKVGENGEQNEYIEGGVLQDNHDESNSSFNLAVVDTAKQMYQLRTFAWTGEFYEQSNDLAWRPFVRNKHRLRSEFNLQPEFEESLGDTDATWLHPAVDRVKLDDVFVYPDSTLFDKNHRKDPTKVVPSKEFVSHVLSQKRVVIIAPERAGKTAISRSLFKDLRRNGKMPLLISGRDIKPQTLRDVNKFFDYEFSKQYPKDLASKYWQLPLNSRAVVVDDYHLIPSIRQLRDTLLRSLVDRFEIVVVLGGSELPIQELAEADRESKMLWQFQHSEILGFGHRLRADFIRKWHRVGRDGAIEDEMLTKRAIELEQTISNILGQDLLPPYPVYLLLLLQTLESNTPLDTTAATYGRLYGAVITAYLAKMGAASGGELETQINYLCELAYYLYSIKRHAISESEARRWHDEYCKRHLEQITYELFLNGLEHAQIIQRRSGCIRFRYRAGFYYFVSYYFADHLSEQPIREEIERLCARLYREDAANIVLFLCHQSKDTLILKEVMKVSHGLFSEKVEIDLIRDAQFVPMIPGQPSPVLIEVGFFAKGWGEDG